MVRARRSGVCAGGNVFPCLRDGRSDDLSTGVLIVIILVDLGLLTFGIRGRVY